MKNKTYMLALIAISIFFPISADASSWQMIEQKRCLGADSCQVGSPLDGCDASIKNCHAHGKCAFCNCNTMGCGCSCRSNSSSNPSSAYLFDDMNDPFELSFDHMTLTGLIDWLRSAPVGEWKFEIDINASELQRNPMAFKRLEGHFESRGRNPKTVQQVLEWFAAEYGVSLVIDQEAKMISFTSTN